MNPRPLKNVRCRHYAASFCNPVCFFQYISDDGTRVLIHYLGHESLYKDLKRGITPKRRARNMFHIKTVKPSESPVGSGSNVVTVYSYKDMVATATKTGGVRIERQ